MAMIFSCATSSLLVDGHARKAIIIPAATNAPPGEHRPSRCPRSRSPSTVPTTLLLVLSYLTQVATHISNLAVASAASARRQLTPTLMAGANTASRVVRLRRGPPPHKGLHRCRHPLVPAM